MKLTELIMSRGIMHFLRNLPRFLKYCWQRIDSGLADCDTWSLDYHLSILLIDGCQRIRDRKIGYPSDLTEEEWKEVLTRIIEGFEAAQIVSDGVLEVKGKYRLLTKEEIKFYTDLFNQGFKLFHKYYFSLWD